MAFSSVSVDGLDDLVSKTQSGMMTIDSFVGQANGYSSIKSDMNELGVTSSATSTLSSIVSWLQDDSLPELRRRLNLARGLQQQSPDSPMVTVNEDLVAAMNSEEAEQRGREIAQQLEDATSEDDINDVMADLEALAYDPDAMAGFYAELGPEAAAIHAANLGQGYAGDNSQRYLELMSVGLGTALQDETRPGDLYDMNDFWQETDNAAEAWGRLALLQYGDFSDNQLFVQFTAEHNALDQFTRDDWNNHYTNISAVSQNPHPGIALPGDLTEMAFLALSKNPEASREALSGYEDFPLGSFVNRVYEAADFPHDRPELADAFGLAIEAGVGAGGDPPRTEHTSEEAEFAFQFIEASGGHNPDDVPFHMMDSLGRIGGAYVHELVAGSWVPQGEQSGTRNNEWAAVPDDFPGNTGLDPAFYLNPETTYQFLGSFQRDLQFSEPFDANAGELYNELFEEAIVADGAHPDDYSSSENVNRLFGSISEMQYQARKDWAADFDAQEQARREAVAQFWGSAAGLLPVPGSYQLAWWGVQGIGNNALGDWADGGGGREDQIINDHATAETLRWYQIVQIMVENGVGGDVIANTPPNLLDDDGNLLPMDEIFSDEDRAAQFYDWVKDTPELNDPSNQANDGWDIGNDNTRDAFGWE